MGIIVKPNATTDGTTASGAAASANWDTIYAEFNGNIDNTNLKANAGIADTKLATISTAAKVNTSALTGTVTNSVSSTTIQSTTITATTINGLVVAATNLTVTNISGTGALIQYADTRYYIAQVSRDMSLSSNLNVTGVTFTPTALTCFMGNQVNSNLKLSQGFAVKAQLGSDLSVGLDKTNPNGSPGSYVIVYADGAATNKVAVSSWNGDGVTLNFVLTNSPTGTAYFNFRFER